MRVVNIIGIPLKSFPTNDLLADGITGSSLSRINATRLRGERNDPRNTVQTASLIVSTETLESQKVNILL